jgi:soluble lytic murein transglycosylase-like protein
VPFSAQIRNGANTYGLDPALVASVIAVESNFNSRAVSKKSAQGLMQLRAETPAQMAVRNAFDPVENIDGGTRYLKQLLDCYRQNLSLALAAYNASPKTSGFLSWNPASGRKLGLNINRVTSRLRNQPDLMRQFFPVTTSQALPTLPVPK